MRRGHQWKHGLPADRSPGFLGWVLPTPDRRGVQKTFAIKGEEEGEAVLHSLVSSQG